MRRPFFKGVALGSAVTVLVLMAGTALAGTGVGAVFNLGKANSANRTSTLTGSTSGKMLQVTNKGSGSALGLTVQAGKPPLAVNSTARVTNLNADSLDGLHMIQGRVRLASSSVWGDIVTVPGLGVLMAYGGSAYFKNTLSATDAVRVWAGNVYWGSVDLGNTSVGLGYSDGGSQTVVLATGTHVATIQVAGAALTGPTGPYLWVAQGVVQ